MDLGYKWAGRYHNQEKVPIGMEGPDSERRCLPAPISIRSKLELIAKPGHGDPEVGELDYARLGLLQTVSYQPTP